MRRFPPLLLLFALVLNAASPARAASASAGKIPLDYKAYDGWNAIRCVAVSDDGAWVAYALVPQDGDGELIVRNLTTGKEMHEARGNAPAFTADSKFVVFSIRAKNVDIHKADAEHKKPDEQPKGGVGILDLTTGAATTFDRVKSVIVPKDAGSDTIAFLYEKPAPSPKATASAAPVGPVPPPPPVPAGFTPTSPPAAAAPSPSASPDALHSIEPGAQLAIRDLAQGTQTTVDDVTEYAVSHDGAYVAYATAAKDPKRDGLHVRTSANGAPQDVLVGQGHYIDPTFAPKADLLAFESDAESFKSKAPHYALYHVDLRGGSASAVARVADEGTDGMAPGWAPSDNGKLAYSKDGKRLFLGTAPAPTPVPSGAPEPVKVSIWSWRDGDLQSYQRKHADEERKRTYGAVVRVDEESPRFVQLATTSMRVIRTNDNGTYALGANDVPYRKELSWLGDVMEDEYAVPLRTGARRLLAKRVYDRGMLSPDGAFVVAYDRAMRGWYSLRTSDGKRTIITASIRVPLYDELDDHPFPPPSYEFGGFAGGSKYALIADRYDLWAVDPATGAAHMLTGGVGRKGHLRFSPVQLDADAERDAFPIDKPIVLRAFDENTKSEGLYVVSLVGPHANEPRKIFMAAKALGPTIVQARKAERIVFSEQRIDEPADLWSAASLDAPRTKISDANPQFTKYVWATDRLISYKSTWGVPLHGVLILPENFDRSKRYPMLVYLYERFSDDLHRMPFTIPAPYTSPNLLRYASNGYVVLVPDIAYRNGHPGKSALGCVLPAVDAVLKEGFVDPKRIGIAGHSWGAYQIAYMITQTDRFRAAEAGAAVDDMISAYGGIREGEGVVREFQYEMSQSRIGATPWDRTDLYLENSPLFGIKNIHTPYLTIANDADDAVPWQQGIEFNTALRRRGKEAYMFEFDGEVHNLRGREQQKYWTVHLDEFFDHFLKGAPEPDWMRQGTDFLHRGERNVHARYGEPAVW